MLGKKRPLPEGMAQAVGNRQCNFLRKSEPKSGLPITARNSEDGWEFAPRREFFSLDAGALISLFPWLWI